MVYQDFSAPSLEKNNQFLIAPVADRFLAFIFDLAIFAPFFSFILAQVFRHITLTYFTSPQSMEFLVLLVVAVCFVAILTILSQTILLVLFGATPGKYFFKMRVISVSNSSTHLRFSQAFLRSALWVGEFFILALPWLEVLSESKRRPLHDRAAGTMVVTIKGQGDQGPHALESHFVRQTLVVSSLAVMIWIIFGLGHFYRQALRGDFKRTELEAEDYLCSTVSQSLDEKELRIDKALALYLAGEISETCLASEADFVLWTPNEMEKDWAYLVKGILSKKDPAQFEAYLQKSCDQDALGKACEIAEYEADPKKKVLPKDSQAALILKVIGDFESGNYAMAEKEFVELSRQRGYEVFSQQGIIKSLWAQNKIEKSKGAYLGVVHQMRASSRVDLSSWICHEELDRQCSQESIEACEDLKTVFRENPTSVVVDSYAALALIREKECRQTTDLDSFPVQNVFRDRKDIQIFVKAISRDSSMTADQRRLWLKDLGFRKDPVRPQFLRLLAIQSWVELENSEDQLRVAVQFLKDKPVRDLSWIKIYQKTLATLLRMKSEKLLAEIAVLPSRELIDQFDLGEGQIRAHFLAKDFERTQKEIHWLKRKHLVMDSDARAPASQNQESLADIEAEVHRKLKGESPPGSGK